MIMICVLHESTCCIRLTAVFHFFYAKIASAWNSGTHWFTRALQTAQTNRESEVGVESLLSSCDCTVRDGEWAVVACSGTLYTYVKWRLRRWGKNKGVSSQGEGEDAYTTYRGWISIGERVQLKLRYPQGVFVVELCRSDPP